MGLFLAGYWPASTVYWPVLEWPVLSDGRHSDQKRHRVILIYHLREWLRLQRKQGKTMTKYRTDDRNNQTLIHDAELNCVVGGRDDILYPKKNVGLSDIDAVTLFVSKAPSQAFAFANHSHSHIRRA